jgi:hypothetical protein
MAAISQDRTPKKGGFWPGLGGGFNDKAIRRLLR